jgi:tetratricopeptide (TPR) repeat protein
MNNLASAYRGAGKVEQALPLFEECLQLKREVLGAEHPDTLLTMNTLGIAYRDAERLEQALAMHTETLQLRRNKLGDNHPDTILALRVLATTEIACEHFAEAETHLQESWRRAQQLTSPQKRGLAANAANQFFKLYEAWQKPAEAAKWQAELDQILAEK